MFAAKTGRNDPCPCGSGKKYKKCCLEKDEAARREAPPAPPPARAAADAFPARQPPASEPPSRQPTPEERWWDDFLVDAETVESADDALVLARRALGEDAPPLPGGEWLLDAFEPLILALAKAGRHAERLDLLEAIEARFSDQLAEELPYLAKWRFESALAQPDVDLVAEARRFGPHVEALLSRNVGMFSRKPHVVGAVAFALPAWTAEVVARGWASADEADEWLRACMDSIGAAFEEVPEDRREALERQVIDFSREDGREVMR